MTEELDRNKMMELSKPSIAEAWALVIALHQADDDDAYVAPLNALPLDDREHMAAIVHALAQVVLGVTERQAEIIRADHKQLLDEYRWQAITTN